MAIVTGAASGIGRATVELLHARGAKVVTQDVNKSVGELTRDGLVTLVADVTDEKSAKKAVALATDSFGRVDILVNNAGRILYKPFVGIASGTELEIEVREPATGHRLGATDSSLVRWRRGQP